MKFATQILPLFNLYHLLITVGFSQPEQPYQPVPMAWNGNPPPQDWYPISQSYQPNQQPNYIAGQQQEPDYPVVDVNTWQGSNVVDNSWQGPVVDANTWQVPAVGDNSWQGPVAPSVQVVDDFYLPQNVPGQSMVLHQWIPIVLVNQNGNLLRIVHKNNQS